MKLLNQEEREIYLINYFLNERNQTILINTYNFDLYRGLVNIRKAQSIDEDYLKIEDEYLQNIKRDITDSDNLVR